MNIDLLRDKRGQFGLVCDQTFSQPPKAVLFDANLGTFSLEFAADDALMCNISVVEDWRHELSMEDSILLGTVSGSILHAAERIPLKALL